jgi:hypothetical protein
LTIVCFWKVACRPNGRINTSARGITVNIAQITATRPVQRREHALCNSHELKNMHALCNLQLAQRGKHCLYERSDC